MKHQQTTGDIRAGYSWDSYNDEPSEIKEAAFDAWLAEHDRTIAAAAWDEGFGDDLLREMPRENPYLN